MNKRQKKKKECKYDLHSSFAKYALPRLKTFRHEVDAYPVRGEVQTMEDWLRVLDKMITAFEYVLAEDSWWIANPEYDFLDGVHWIKNENGSYRLEDEEWVAPIKEKHYAEEQRRYEVMQEGLRLFAEYFQDLWW